MADLPTRRFTDREIAAVLRHAADLDERSGTSEGGGLSLEELREIAAEVGISATAIDRAVAALDRPASVGSWLGGAPAVRRAVRALPNELGKEQIARLVEVVDEQHDSAGAVSEALGSVRWTVSDRMHSSMVSIRPEKGETAIKVVEKINPRLRAVAHFMPAAWALMFAAPMVGAIQAGPGATAGLLVGSLAAGFGAGRIAWNVFSGKSRRRVERMADSLVDEGVRLLPPPGESP